MRDNTCADARTVWWGSPIIISLIGNVIPSIHHEQWHKKYIFYYYYILNVSAVSTLFATTNID
jgi:hypothetical protein